MSRDRDSSRRSASGAKADRILEQALKHELSAAGTPPAGACLEAETLAAWVDGGLDAAAMATAEAHVSNCARCQSLIGTMLKGAPTAPGTASTLGTPGTLPLWRWWLAPIAAGVTAVTLWTVIPEQQRVAVAPPQAKSDIAVQPPTAAAKATPVGKDQNVSKERTEARDNLTAAARADQAPLRDAAAAPKEEAAKLPEAVTIQRQEAAPAAPAAAAPPATTGFEPLAGLQKRARAGIPPNGIEIPTLQPSVRWRIVGDYFIEVSEDGGASWDRKHQLPGVHIGSAPSASVCWLAGGNGSVWLTTDGGETFRQVGLAEPLDIASISATDARAASVFTVNGRRFRTQDGGRTWLPF